MRLGRRRVAAAGMLIAALLLGYGSGSGHAESSASLEYKVKGAFLLNFARFTKWPAEVFAAANSPLTVGIVGDAPFGSAIDELVAGESIGERPIVVKRMKPTDDLSQCQVLFIPRSVNAGELLKRLGGTGVLTVGESDGFLETGGVIQFVVEQNRVRFEVNNGAAHRARLELSSQLLKLAKMVMP